MIFTSIGHPEPANSPLELPRVCSSFRRISIRTYCSKECMPCACDSPSSARQWSSAHQRPMRAMIASRSAVDAQLASLSLKSRSFSIACRAARPRLSAIITTRKHGPKKKMLIHMNTGRL